MANPSSHTPHDRSDAPYKRKRILFAILALPCVALVFWLVSYLLQAPVQKKLVITAGGKSGIYKEFADQYAVALKKAGVALDVRLSSGAVENYQRLKDDASEYEIGFIQSGIGNSKDAPKLQTIASVYYEPIWLFYRSSHTIALLSQLKGQRISIGVPGSGMHKITRNLLAEYGVSGSNTTLQELRAQDAFESLQAGKTDAAFFIGAPDTPLIQTILQSDFRLMSFAQADAIARKFPSLSKVSFPRGAINLTRDLPPQDVVLLSVTALLVAKDKLDPALIYLMLDVANEIHGVPGFFMARGEFPNQKIEDFPISDETRQYFKSGRPFLQRYLPFGLANFIERRFVILVPLIAILFTLMQMFPRLYGLRIKHRLVRWYAEIKLLEDEVWISRDPSEARIAEWHARIEEIGVAVNRLDMPERYYSDVYVLKQSIGLVRERIAVAAREVVRMGVLGGGV